LLNLQTHKVDFKRIANAILEFELKLS